MSELSASVRRLKRVEYDRLVAAGMFDHERVELIDGMVMQMAPRGPEHDGTIEIVAALLGSAIGDRASVRIQSSFAATANAEPEPDLAVVPSRDYRDEHPREAFLIVEVAVSSAAYDRDKAATYARAGVPEYWIVDVPRSVVEVHLGPAGDAYEQRTTHRRGDTLRPTAFPDVAIPLDRILRD